jgi:hypothetical protein
LSEFFSGDFSGKRTADPERSSPTYYTSIDAVLAKEVPFGGLIDTSHPMGELSPKNPNFGAVNGSPSLKVYRRISAQEKRIMTLDSSICASRQDTQCAIVKTKGWGHCRGQTYKSLFQSQISKLSRKCRITFQRYTPDEKHQQTTYRKPMPQNRLVTSEFVCDTT